MHHLVSCETVIRNAPCVIHMSDRHGVSPRIAPVFCVRMSSDVVADSYKSLASSCSFFLCLVLLCDAACGFAREHAFELMKMKT